jgi:hypothetical protein
LAPINLNQRLLLGRYAHCRLWAQTDAHHQIRESLKACNLNPRALSGALGEARMVHEFAALPARALDSKDQRCSAPSNTSHLSYSGNMRCKQ